MQDLEKVIRVGTTTAMLTAKKEEPFVIDWTTICAGPEAELKSSLSQMRGAILVLSLYLRERPKTGMICIVTIRDSGSLSEIITAYEIPAYLMLSYPNSIKTVLGTITDYLTDLMTKTCGSMNTVIVNGWITGVDLDSTHFQQLGTQSDAPAM